MADVIQQATEAAFLADRLRSLVMGDRDRCTGISSDALTLYGVRGGPEPQPFDYPADLGDLRACERTYLMAPDEVRARMLPVLGKYRAHVAQRRHRYPSPGRCPGMADRSGLSWACTERPNHTGDCLATTEGGPRG